MCIRDRVSTQSTWGTCNNGSTIHQQRPQGVYALPRKDLEYKDPIERKYQINMDLKRYEKAVIELSKGTEEQQNLTIKLIQQHNLFNVGMKLYKNNQILLKKVKFALGDYLQNKKELQQAQLAYESAEEYEKALEIAIENFDIQRSIDISKNFLKYTQQDINEKILGKILEHAQEVSNYAICGKIYRKLENYEKAIEAYIKCENWKNCLKCSRYLSSQTKEQYKNCLLYTSPSPRDQA
eukprot:TRINITY_DN1119_c0_g1_i1.p1 TRINITY_DN1119_c0_g1~~TRINITY_DN1119_c0_g1_i1.p1  ORF type:complete len:238 (-),score=53.99 TRINITY_DN1119_c0_g1_i1:47-760(-)